MSVRPAPAAHRDASRLAVFIASFRALLDRTSDEADILDRGEYLLRDLVARDDWLPDLYARPHPDHYQQYLLYADPAARFSVVSFVWGPGQATPVHDHTVWGLVGMLRGSERVESYHLEPDGMLVPQGAGILARGEVDAVSPRIGDIHRVANGEAHVSVSIHVYGADIGKVRRSVFTASGARKPFISGYADAPVPLLESFL